MKVTLTSEEWRTLRYLSDRYSSADVLWCAGTDRDDGSAVLYITPDVLRDYWRALWDDNGDAAQTVPPCAGGTLAEKLRSIPGRPLELVDIYRGQWEATDLAMCGDCLCLLANGDDPPDLDETATDRYRTAVDRGETNGWTTVPGSQDCEHCGAEIRAAREALGEDDPWRECEGWFSCLPCDVCGSGRWADEDPFARGTLGGDRYHAVTFPIR